MFLTQVVGTRRVRAFDKSQLSGLVELKSIVYYIVKYLFSSTASLLRMSNIIPKLEEMLFWRPTLEEFGRVRNTDYRYVALTLTIFVGSPQIIKIVVWQQEFRVSWRPRRHQSSCYTSREKSQNLPLILEAVVRHLTNLPVAGAAAARGRWITVDWTAEAVPMSHWPSCSR